MPSLVLLPGHKFYDLIHRRARYKVYWGGRGSGKSWAIAEALIRIAAVRRIRVLCTREYQISIKDSSHKILKDTIERLGMQSFFKATAEGIFSRCGSEFIFKGFHGSDQNQSIKSVEGIDICWVEEAQSVSKSSWQSLAPTMRKPGSEIWVSYNMINETDPTHERFVINPRSNAIVHKINFDENPFFKGSPMEQEMLDDKAESEHLFEHIWLGMPLVIDDSIILSGKYRVLTDDQAVTEFPDDLYLQADRLHLGADFGYAVDPSTLIRSFVIANEVNGRVRKKLYVSHEAYRVGVENNEYGDFYDQIPDARQWGIKADCSMPGLISHIRNEFGYRIEGAEKWAGSVEDGIKYLRGFEEIIIHPRCKHTAEEARLWRWKVDKKTGEVLPVPVDKHNHCWDAVRYGHDGYIDRSGDLGIWARYAKAVS